MVTSRPIMYLIMEDQFLSRCLRRNRPASEFEDAEPLIGKTGRHCGPAVVCTGPDTDRPARRDVRQPHERSGCRPYRRGYLRVHRVSASITQREPAGEPV